MELDMNEVIARLAAAVSALEEATGRLEQSGEVKKITASIEGSLETSAREMELERRLAQAEQTIAALQAVGVTEAPKVSARKTLPSATVQLLAKQGIDAGDSVDLQSLDAALAGLSVEQRIAVKSQMLRTGSLVR